MGILDGGTGPADFCRTLFESMGDACTYSRLIYEGEEPVDWVHLEVNAAYEAWLGQKHLAGRRVSEVVPGLRASAPNLFELCGRVATGSGPKSLECFVKPLEAWFSVEVMSPGPGEFIARFQHTTAQTTADKALAEAMALLERTGELAKVGGCLIDVATMRQRWTPEVFRILELAPGDAPTLDQGLAYCSPEARPLLKAAVEACLETGAPFDLEVSARTAKGRPIRVRTQGIPVLREGHTIEVIGTLQDITERFQADAALRTSEKKFSLAFLGSRDGVNITRLSDGRVLDVMGGFVQTLGYSREEVLGRSTFPGDLGLWARREDLERLQADLLREGLVQGLETQFLCKDGTALETLVSAALVDVEGEPCILFITRDNQERKRAEVAHRKQEAFVRSILDNLPVGIAVTPDEPGAPAYMNDLFPRCYRTTREALEGAASDPEVFWTQAYEDPATRAAIKARVLADLGSGDPARMHWERIPLAREGKETTFVDARNIPVPGTSTMISTVWDVTDQVRREEATRRLADQLHQVQKMEGLGRLAGGVAHDINNVLASILALATVHLRKAPGGTPLHQGLEAIAKACIRGGSLVKALLGFARKDLREERVLNLNELAREELSLLERTSLQKIALKGELGADLQDIHGDPAALSHALMNLCVNAIDAMPEGGALTIRTRNEGPGSVVLEIEDTGMGMAPEVLEQAMLPFYTTKPAGSGTGLGLSIAYGTVRAHRGSIDLRSEPGRGTLVRLRFPTPDATLVDDPRPVASESAGPTTRNTSCS